MPRIRRVLVIAAFLWTTAPIAVRAQFVVVFPRVIRFELTARTLIPPEQPPGSFIEIAPGPVGVDKVPFRLREIRLNTLPSGAATNFVIVSPSSGVARATTRVALNPKVLPYMSPGVYNLDVVFHNPEHPELGADSTSVTLWLKLPGSLEITSVMNAASLRPGVSPGQLVTIRGAHLSTPPVTGEPDSAGLYPTVIGHTRVTFNGIPAPLLYVSNDQINCVVPQGVAGSRTAQVVVELVTEPASATIRSPAFAVSVSDAAPGIFTADQSGSGPGAILNTGAGAGLNTESNPAAKGTAVTFYATGAGAWNVLYPDGSIVLAPALALPPPTPVYLAPAAPVSVTIGGQIAKTLLVAAQRMRVLGSLEVTAEIPSGIGSGAQPVVLKIGENDNAQQNVTVWVR